MDSADFRKILEKYIEGNCNESERKTVDEWLDQLSAHGDGVIQDPIKAKEKFLENIKTRLGETRLGEARLGETRLGKAKDELPFRRRRLAIVAGIAAMLLLTFGAIQQFYLKKLSSLAENTLKQEDSIIINTSNVSKTTRLADGSDVTLYPNSKLTHVSFTEGERRMRLEGKAFFKVAPNPKRPFIIVTERLITKVLGTSFTIRAEKGEAETVAVKTGKVAVYKSANAALENLPGAFVAVTPNHQVCFDEANERLVTSIVNHPVIIPSAAPSLKDKDPDAAPPVNYDMKFEETSVAEILKALEAAYGVKIKFDGEKMSGCIITAYLKDEDLFMRLQVVCDLIGGSYQVDGDVIKVKSRGCK